MENKEVESLTQCQACSMMFTDVEAARHHWFANHGTLVMAAWDKMEDNLRRMTKAVAYYGCKDFYDREAMNDEGSVARQTLRGEDPLADCLLNYDDLLKEDD